MVVFTLSLRVAEQVFMSDGSRELGRWSSEELDDFHAPKNSTNSAALQCCEHRTIMDEQIGSSSVSVVSCR